MMKIDSIKIEMDVVFLIINYMPHQLVSINALIENHNIRVHAFNYKNNTKIPENHNKLITYRISDFKHSNFVKKIFDINPAMIVVAGWFVPEYVDVSKKVRKKLDIPIVTYSDTQWYNSFKQKINSIISPFHIKKAFTHIWVSGIYQFEYARKLGFKKNEIIYNALSCDVKLFNNISSGINKTKKNKNFLYVGRFAKEKGLDILLEAWKQIYDKKGWSLTLIGEGPYKNMFQNIDDVKLKEYMTQTELIKEFEKSDCFILPSIFEPWALVLHEAATAGLPIIATNACGAAPHFVISGYNGYQIDPSVSSLKKAIIKIISLNQTQLIQYSISSKKLSKRITPELGAAQLMSIIQ